MCDTEVIKEDSEEEKKGQTIMEIATEPVREDSEEEKHGQTTLEVTNEPVREDSEEEKQISSEKSDDSMKAEDSAVEYGVKVTGEVLLEEVTVSQNKEKLDQEQVITLEKLKVNVVPDEKSSSDDSLMSPIQDKYIPPWMKPVTQYTVYQNDDKEREIHRKNVEEADDKKQQQDVYVPPSQQPSTGTLYQNYPIPPPLPPRLPQKKPPANLPDSPPQIPVRSVVVPKFSQQIPEEKPPPVPDKSYRSSRFSREFQTTGNTTPEDDGKMSKLAKSPSESGEVVFEVSGTLPQGDKIVTETLTRSEKCDKKEGIKQELLATPIKSVKHLTQMFENKPLSDLPAKDNPRDIVTKTSGETTESRPDLHNVLQSNDSDSEEFHSMGEDNDKFDMQLEKYQQDQQAKNLEFEQMSSNNSISENYSLENASDVIRSMQTVLVLYEDNQDIDEKTPPLPSQPPSLLSQPPSSTSQTPPLPSQPPSSTSQPPPLPSQPPSSTSQPPPLPSQQQSSTSQPPPLPSQQQSSTSQPPPLPSQPPSSTSQPPPLPSQPQSSTSQPPLSDESYTALRFTDNKIQTAPSDLSVTKETLTQQKEDPQDDSQMTGDRQVSSLIIQLGKDTKFSTDKQDEETKTLQDVDVRPVPVQYSGTRHGFDQQHSVYKKPFQQDENPQGVPVYQQTETAPTYDPRLQQAQPLPFPHTENKGTKPQGHYAHQQDLHHNQGHYMQQFQSQNLNPQSYLSLVYGQPFFQPGRQQYNRNVYNYPPQQFQGHFNQNPQPHWQAPSHKQPLAAEVKHSKHSQRDKNTDQTSTEKPSPVVTKSKKKTKRTRSGDLKEKIHHHAEKGARKPEIKQDSTQHHGKKEEEHFPEKFSICIRGLEPTCNCEIVCLYLESMAQHVHKPFDGEVDSSDVVYGEDKTIAVFTFSETLDFHKLKKKCSEKPFESAYLEICEAGPVRGIVVSSSQEMPSKSALKQYFQNTAVSGGGNITKCLSTEDDCRKIYFRDTSAADSVCKKSDHSVEGVPLSVTKLFECEFGEVWDQQKHKEEEHFPEKFSICIRGLEPTCNCEIVCLYLESMAQHVHKPFDGEVDSSDVVYGEDKTIAVFTFSETLDFHKLKKKCSEKPFESAYLEICEAGPVRGIVVSSSQEMPSKSALKQYFQNTAVSGGGNITKCLSTEDDCRKIYFRDTSAADSVCKKSDHSVEGVPLSVTKLFECEFGEVWDQQKHKVCLPQDLKTDDVNPDKKIFISKSTKVLSLINDRLDPLFAKVKVTEDLYIECTLQQTTQNVRQLAKTWEEKVKNVWLEFVEESTQKAEMCVEEEIWPQLLPHVNKIKENDMLHINVTEEGNVTKLTFVGHIDIFETVTTDIRKQKEEIVAKVERKKNITEDRMQIPMLEVRLLARIETLSEVNKIAEDLKVSADEEKGMINFSGVHEDIEKAKVKIYESIQSFGKLQVKSGSDDIHKEQIDLLEKNTDILEKWVKEKFCSQDMKVELSFGKEGDEYVINVRYLQGSDVSKIKKIFSDATKWVSKCFETSESKAVLSTHRWKKEIRNVEQKYEKEVIITSDPKKSQVTVTCTPNIHTEIVNRLLDFVKTNAVYCEKFTVNDEGKMKFIKQHCNDMIRTLENNFEEFYADIEVEDENFVLRGTKQGLKQMKHEICKIVDGILSKTHTITRLGLDSVIGPGKEEFASVERRTRSVVTFVDTGQSSGVTSVAYDESYSDEDEYTITEVGETWRTKESRLADRVEEEETIFGSVTQPTSAAPEKTKVKCKNGIVIRLVKGELGKQKADVLVCTTSKELDLSKGKCGANLLNIGGKELQTQCQSSYPNGVNCGDVAVIDSGKLDCRKVYLGNLPTWNADDPNKRSIKVFIKNCLEKANSSGFQSIYFASLGTGGLNYPLPDTANLMYEAVKEYDERKSSSSVKDVRFVLYKKDVPVISAFENEEYSQLHPSTRVASAQKLQGPFDTKKGIKITFVEGPIDQQKAHVIVCAVSKELNVGGSGVGKALVTTGGESLVTECKTNYPRGINFGDVIEVNGGKLKCKKVYLSSLPDYNSEEEKAKTKIKEKTLYKVVYQFLDKAVKAGMKSIALPAMGTRQINWPASYVASLMYDCVVEFASSHPNCCLADVRFVVISNDKTTAQAFRDEEQRRLSPPQQYSSGLKSFYTKRGKVQVSIETGSISKFTKADIIVCSVSDNLDLTHGKVGEALLQEGGITLQQECSKNYPSGIKVNEIAKIGPGKLQCKGVYLVTFPRYAAGKEKECDKLLLDSIRKVLETASADGMTSVAFPALGTGYKKFPEDRVATLSYEAVMMYDKSPQTTPIKSVSFVLLPSHTTAVKAFQREELKRKGVPPSSPSQDIMPRAAARQSLMARVINTLQGATIGQGAKLKRTFTVTGDGRPNTVDTPKARPGIVIAQSRKSSKPNEFKFGLISLTIGQGNIADMRRPVDAIVNSTNDSLDLTMGGVTKAILDKCDSKQLNEECKPKKAEMKKTGVTYTSACGLKNCQTIIHVTAQDTLKDWQKIMVKCLELADDLKFSSMAFPALGTGSGFTIFKCEEIAETLHDSLIEFTTKRPNQNLRVIRLIIFDHQMVWPMTQTMMTCCQSSSTPSYKQKMGDFLSGLGLAPRRGLASRSSTSSSVTLWILSDTDQEIQKAIDEITNIVDNKYTTNSNTDKLIESLEKEEITKIENLKKKFVVDISVDQAKCLITIQGTKEEVDSAKAQVHKFFSAFQFRRHEESEAEHFATQVQWYCKKKNNSGLLELEPYPKLINMKLENTLRGNFPYLDFKANGIDCRVDIATMKEFEIKDPSNTSTDVIRREKQAEDDEAKLLREAFDSGTEEDYHIRINFVGHFAAGKTSLMLQTLYETFKPEDITSTNGIDLSVGNCCIDIESGRWYKEGWLTEEDKTVQRVMLVLQSDSSQPEKKEESVEIDHHDSTELVYDREAQISNTMIDQEMTKVQELQSKIPKFSQPEVETREKRKARHTASKQEQSTTTMVLHSSDKKQVNALLMKAKSMSSGRKEKQAFVRGFDYAGQCVFYTVHQLFFSQRGVNIIVIDGSLDFNSYVKDDDCRQIGGKIRDKTAKEFFQFWAKSLRFSLQNRNQQQIIVVVTHKDKMKKTDFDKIEYQVKRMINEMKMNEMFLEEMFWINCNNPADSQLESLRVNLLKLSKTHDDWGEEMPSRWLLLEDKMMKEKSNGTRIMKLTEVIDLNRSSVLPLPSNEEIKLFLKKNHDLGKMLYYADDGLKELVIIDPQWLVDSLKLIITAESFWLPGYEEELKKLKDTGVLDKQLMEEIWKSKPKERFDEFKKELVLLMSKLDLISNSRMYDNDGKQHERPFFVVPCMLDSAPSDFMPNYRRKSRSRNIPLVFQFNDDFLPSAIVYRLLATCNMYYGEDNPTNTIQIYCNAAVFKVGEGHYLILEYKDNCIVADVISTTKKNTDVGICQGVREFLDDTLQCIIAPHKAFMKYTLNVSCGEGEEFGKYALISWDRILVDTQIECEGHRPNPSHLVRIQEITDHWILKRKRRPSISKKIEEKDFSTPTQCFLGRFARRVSPENYTTIFGESLNIKLCYIKQEEQNSKNKIVDLMLRLLLRWLKSKTSEADFKELVEAFSKEAPLEFSMEEIFSPVYEWQEGLELSAEGLSQPIQNNITDEDLDNICKSCGARYFQLGLELGFKDNEVDAFQGDYEKCFEISKQMIKKWFQDKKSEATWGVLGDAISEIGCDVGYIKNRIT